VELKLNLKQLALVFAATVLLCGAVSAGDLVFESGLKKVQLLELFTSEGCSSCPPAEAALTRLMSDPRLWREFVPVAFHVDYWDHLGWKDPFARGDWTRRQRQYAANWRGDTVYTPAFVLDGREWRGATVPVATGDPAGNLKLWRRSNELFAVSFEPAKPGNFDAYVGRLGFGVISNVRAGENSGRTFRDDFIVLSLASEKLTSPIQEFRLPAVGLDQKVQKTAVAVWVTKSGEITPIQATGGWLPN
jgi:Uncharacterized secreted protein